MFDNIEDEIMDDAEYLTIVNPILENKEFQRLVDVFIMVQQDFII